MSTPWQPDSDFERRVASRLLDVLIRAALIGVLAVLCYVVFAPFLTLMVWAVILAVTLYPLHRALARRLADDRASPRQLWSSAVACSSSRRRRSW